MPASIRLLALDVDGVLTDGSIYLDAQGIETKRFHVRDGFAIKLWQKAGFATAILSARTTPAVDRRAAELGITHVIQGASDKSAGLDDLIARSAIPAEQIAFVGDDWLDIPALRRVGFSVAVADADPRVKEACSYVTRAHGGNGAVREVVEHLLSAKGVLESLAASITRAATSVSPAEPRF